MKGKFKDRVTPLMTSAINIACSSLSNTEGTAIGQAVLSSGHSLRPVEQFHFRRCFVSAPFQSVLITCPYECLEQWMRLQRLRFEFGMELTANEMRMVGQFHHLDVRPIRSRP